MQNVQYNDMHQRRRRLQFRALRHKEMPRWKLAASITAYKGCRRWLMMNLRHAVNQATTEVNFQHSSSSGVSEAPAIPAYVQA